MIKMYKDGFVALLSTVVVMTVLLVYLTFSQEITGALLDDSLHNRLGSEVDFVAESCLEDTLLLLRADPTYAGDELNLADGFCTITVTGAGQTKTIVIVASTLNKYYRTLSAEVDVIDVNDTQQIILNSVVIN